MITKWWHQESHDRRDKAQHKTLTSTEKSVAALAIKFLAIGLEAQLVH